MGVYVEGITEPTERIANGQNQMFILSIKINKGGLDYNSKCKISAQEFHDDINK